MIDRTDTDICAIAECGCRTFATFLLTANISLIKYEYDCLMYCENDSAVQFQLWSVLVNSAGWEMSSSLLAVAKGSVWLIVQ